MKFLSYVVVEKSLTKIVERKKKGQIQGRINGSQSHDVTSNCQLTYKMYTFHLEQLRRNLLRKNYTMDCTEKRKDNRYEEEQRGQSPLAIPEYNLSLFCIPNINSLSYIVVEMSFTKIVEKYEHIQGRLNRIMPVLNPTMYQIIVN